MDKGFDVNLGTNWGFKRLHSHTLLKSNGVEAQQAEGDESEVGLTLRLIPWKAPFTVPEHFDVQTISGQDKGPADWAGLVLARWKPSGWATGRQGQGWNEHNPSMETWVKTSYASKSELCREIPWSPWPGSEPFSPKRVNCRPN
jgi:hypothetical protein